jgi:excisionase family DNA binding protein
MKHLLTPKQVAQAIGVSESSLKRWCDRGALKMVKTAGGHRRLALDDVIAFLRQSGHQIVRPELLGLPPARNQSPATIERGRQLVREALLLGDEERCRRIVMDLYLAGMRVSEIGDQVLAGAFHDIGDAWACGDISIYRERRGCEIAMHSLRDLRGALPEPSLDAPIAIGGTFENDPYQLPTLMVELALREAGWQATSLGTLLPAATLMDALRDSKPRLLWLSVSSFQDVGHFLADFATLFRAAAEAGTAVVVGGRALSEVVRRQMSYSAYCDTLGHLVAFAQSLRQKA